jgi:hypothetical protein
MVHVAERYNDAIEAYRRAESAVGPNAVIELNIAGCYLSLEEHAVRSSHQICLTNDWDDDGMLQAACRSSFLAAGS